MAKSFFLRIRALRTPISFSLLAFSVIVTMLTLYVVQPRLLRQLDLNVYDALLPLRKNAEPSPVPVIVDIDDASLAAFGQWPWPRYLLAELIEKITHEGALAIGLDVLLAEVDRSSPLRIQGYLQRDKGVRLDLKALPESLLDYDALLAKKLDSSPVVLGAYAEFGDVAAHKTLPKDMPPSVTVIARGSAGALPYTSHLLKAAGAILPLPVLRQESPIGFFNMSPDMDGLVRQVPLILQLKDATYPSLALRSLMVALGVDRLTVFSGPDGLEALKVGDYKIALTPQGAMLVPFQGPKKTYPYISAVDVLQGRVSAEALQGRIVFVGTSAKGLLDIRATPFDRVFPGVEVHAAVIDAIVSENSVSEPPWAPGVQVMGIFSFGLIAALAFGLARPRVYAPLALIMLGLAVFSARHFFMQGLFISPIYILLTIVLQASAMLFLRFLHEERQKIMIRGTFSRYVSPEVVKRITKLRGDVFSGEERELSIMFTDIRGFTSLSEGLTPQQVVLLLNRYFTPMTALVRQENGTLDKFIGDALMAFWNAPVEVPDHPARAVATAIAMQDGLLKMNDALHAEFGIRLAMGVGVHTGNAYVGNMGSNELINYTLIGDNVNLAARLEGLCSQYGAPIVVSEETMRRCGDRFAFQFLDQLRVKGKQQPVKIYQPMSVATWQARQAEMALWQVASTRYTQGAFGEAVALFDELHQRHPDNRLYAAYKERTELLNENPPPDWDGVWVALKK